MEVLGVIASSIAVAQALVAGRHIVNLIRDIPEIQKEYNLLKNEIELIADFIHESKRFGTSEFANDRSQRLLSITAQQLTNIEDELKGIVRRCAQGSSSNISKRRWLLRERKIEQLREKARNAKSDLQNATLLHHQAVVTNRLKKQDEYAVYKASVPLWAFSY
ncbi:hypothetical protein FSARC_4296 [Fusarium sarcochroum]|uniref:Fungal N-terminal domain-containing protein n=1 Tax=Fusarium sarcochroum TaxID=1208366 RepID=A0A8H4U2N0_9HYPO|nr:hypothetical protein FSARC_4296 [Fusarium sarcochroum]